LAVERRSIIARFERSGRVAAEFCRTESLAPNTFWLLRRKLSGAARPIAPSGPVGKAALVELADEPESTSV